jgi:1-deoxy-D-xylulose-5-phosphate synthase
MKQRYRKAMSHSKATRVIYRATRHVKDWVKRMLLPTTIFENMGLTYLGPVDGNDLQGMISLLKLAKGMKKPVVIHVLTRKGLGYGPAENNPAKFHGIGRFDPATGEPLKATKPTFSQAFGEAMVQLGKENEKLCAITAAMPDGTGLLPFMEAFPERTFDVGIAEEHAVSMAGGLAKQGMVPVVAIYSTFLQRAYDQILQDIAMLKLHVVLAVDRAGLVGEDGETHHGVFDVGYLGMVPGMKILAPVCCTELREMLQWAVNDFDGPVAIRYPRGGDGLVCESSWEHGPVVTYRRGNDGVILTYGTLTNEALKAADLLAERGVRVSVMRPLQINPLPMENIGMLFDGQKNVLIAEEAVGGIAESLARKMQQLYPDVKIRTCDLGCEYVPHGNIADLYWHTGLDASALAEKMMEVCGIEN